jgi:hypothetical protein
MEAKEMQEKRNGKGSVRKDVPPVPQNPSEPTDKKGVSQLSPSPPEPNKKEVAPDKKTKTKAETAKKAKEKTPKEAKFPIDAFVNEYGFLKIKRTTLEKIGWYEKLDERRNKKVNVKLDFKDGALVVKRA